MTKALKERAIKAVEECRKENPNQYVDWGFHHYGNDYHIVEVAVYKAGAENRKEFENIFNVYRVNRYSIFNTLVGTFSI